MSVDDGDRKGRTESVEGERFCQREVRQGVIWGMGQSGGFPPESGSSTRAHERGLP